MIYLFSGYRMVSADRENFGPVRKFPKESEDAARRAGEPLAHLEHQCLTKAAATFEFSDGVQPKFNFGFLVIRFSHSVWPNIFS